MNSGPIFVAVDETTPALTRNRSDPADARPGAARAAADEEFFPHRLRMSRPRPANFAPDEYAAHGEPMDDRMKGRPRDGGRDRMPSALDHSRGIETDSAHCEGDSPGRCRIDAVPVEEGSGDPRPGSDRAAFTGSRQGIGRRFPAVDRNGSAFDPEERRPADPALAPPAAQE